MSMEGIDITFKAAADLSAKQYYAMYLSAANTVNTAGANAKVVGILQNKPDAAGKDAIVRVVGISKHVFGEAAAVGKFITSTSAGKGEIADAAGEFIYGVVIEASTADADIGQLLLTQCEAYNSDA